MTLFVGYGAREQLWLEVISPSDVAFAYKIRPARNFGDVITKPYRNIRLVPTQPEEGCSQIINGERLKGQVAFIKRGLAKVSLSCVDLNFELAVLCYLPIGRAVMSSSLEREIGGLNQWRC